MKVGDRLKINDWEILVAERPTKGFFLQSPNHETTYCLDSSQKRYYNTLKELELAIYKSELRYLQTHVLKLEQHLYLGGYTYFVDNIKSRIDPVYYLANLDGANDDIFAYLKIEDKISWCQQYTKEPMNSGIFPNHSTLDKLRCTVIGLLNELIKESNKVTLLQVETEPKLIKL